MNAQDFLYNENPYSIVKSPKTLNKSYTKLCIIIDSNTPIIMRSSTPASRITLGIFKEIASLQNNNCKFYFKSTDSEFGLVKEEIVDDNSPLPYDGDKIVAWVITDKSNQSSLFEFEKKTPQKESISNEKIYTTTQPIHSNEKASYQNFTTFRIDLDLHDNNFLGLTLIGSNICEDSFDRGIFVKAVSKYSVVDVDGRIQIGDRIMSINDIELTGMKDNDAIATFKACVQRRGAINLVLTRKLNSDIPFNICNGQYGSIYDRSNDEQQPSPSFLCRQNNHSTNPNLAPPPMFSNSDASTISCRDNCIYPDTKTTNAAFKRLISSRTQSLPRSITPRSLYAQNNFEISSESVNNNSATYIRHDAKSVYDSIGPSALANQPGVILHCKKDDIRTIYSALKDDSRSLEIKDREWLRVVIKMCFLGSDLINWLNQNVFGFRSRREIKQFANQMLTIGLIKNPLSSKTFSEKCFYTLS